MNGISNFIMACTLVKLEGLKAVCVAHELGVDLLEHIDFVIAALREELDALDLVPLSVG